LTGEPRSREKTLLQFIAGQTMGVSNGGQNGRQGANTQRVMQRNSDVMLRW